VVQVFGERNLKMNFMKVFGYIVASAAILVIICLYVLIKIIMIIMTLFNDNKRWYTCILQLMLVLV